MEADGAKSGMLAFLPRAVIQRVQFRLRERRTNRALVVSEADRLIRKHGPAGAMTELVRLRRWCSDPDMANFWASVSVVVADHGRRTRATGQTRSIATPPAAGNRLS